MSRPTPRAQMARHLEIAALERGEAWLTEAWRIADRLRKAGAVRDAQRLEDACEAAERQADAAAKADSWKGTRWRHAAEGVVCRVLTEPEVRDARPHVRVADESGRRWMPVWELVQDYRRV